ncbi:DUF4259 domain-containing protein [Hymenobacter jejuensis]|uniref:DUF4259 domain-containing protein n=1 Tax=Hymenobacter jejuensis TaxID=2502781 RepID=A0A5B8A5H3_9BACT|nr:DUF4259 domain-containing protein [Hymenobacter jejuensis]QDA61946.1 DUF4259 domain-containing protein [Hymenobacter jejuensis]
MATWGYHNFDNDAAADFAEDFRDNPNEAVLLEALAAVAEEEEHIDADAASEALAAAEIIAAVMGKPAQDLPVDLIPVIVKMDTDESEDLLELARGAVKAILKESALQEHWAGSDNAADWQHLQRDLLERLK